MFIVSVMRFLSTSPYPYRKPHALTSRLRVRGVLVPFQGVRPR
jgi:hypothetical protein